MMGECENALKTFKETFFTNTVKHSLGVKEKKKAKVGCKWHPSFPKTQPCFDFLKF